MGSEVKCRARFAKQQSEGKALLETNEIIFRGDFRLKIPFATIQSMKIVGDDLQVRTPEGLATFELGAATAAKWREKILHPKTRIEKLGIKPAMKVLLIGFENQDDQFVTEIQNAKAVITSSKDELPKDITEGDVFGAGHKAGLTDIKVVGFSPTHTALKFVIPVNKR